MQETREIRHSALEYAYIGDCVYELRVRTYLAGLGSFRIGELHSRAVAFVNAAAQYRAAKAMLPSFTEEEREIFMKGRNAHPHHCPRGATHEEYAYATALESRFGYMYLSGQDDRITELFDGCLTFLLENPA